MLEKEKTLVFQYFILYPQYFQKLFSQGCLKSILLRKGLIQDICHINLKISLSSCFVLPSVH